MQISSKVALSISLVVGVVGLAASFVAIQRQAQVQREEFEETNEQALELLGLAVAPAMAQHRHERVQSVLDSIANFREERFTQVVDIEVVNLDRQVVAAYDPTRYNDAVDDPSLAHDLGLERTTSEYDPTDEHLLRVVVPLRLEYPLGVLRATLSNTGYAASIQRRLLNAIPLLLATIALIGVALHLVHRRLIGARLTLLAKAAAALGRGDASTEAATRGDDEIAALGESFNAMAREVRKYTQDLEELIDERTDELRQANTRLEKMATTDQLTGVWNRHYFEDAARRALEVARRNERPLCVALVDTDKFKSINDTFGHPVGDRVLKVVADVLQSNARKADLVARIGGEEFAVLMPEANIALAEGAAERMRAALESDVRPRVPELGERVVTASFGVAAFALAGDRLEDLLADADEAMYRSKTAGRNRVTIAERATAASE